MCIGIWTLAHPHYALILGTNRDEFLHRPTQNAHFHAFGVDNAPPSVLSGRDEQAGGSWFGINRAGRVALLTNITELPKKYTTSRGSLVSSFLLSESTHPLLQPNDGDPKNNNRREGADGDGTDESESRQQEQQPEQDPHQLLWEIIPKDAQFAGFNLLLLEPSVEEAEDEASKAQEGHDIQRDGSRRRVRYTPLFVTNHGGGGQVVARALTPNERLCGGMSNGIDGQGAELWPKVQHATHDFDSALHRIQRLVQVQVESRVQNEQDLAPRTRTLTEIEVSPTDEPTTDAETEAELVDAVFNLLSWHPPKKISTRAELRETVQVHPIRITLADSVSNNAGRPQPSDSDSASPESPPPDDPTTTPAPSPPSAANLQPGTSSGTITTHTTPPPDLSSPTGPELAGRPDVTENQSSNMTPTPPAPGSSSSGTVAVAATDTTPAYYATRLSTVLLVSRQGEVTFIERDIWELPLESDGFGKGEGHGIDRRSGSGGGLGSGLDPVSSKTSSSPSPASSILHPTPTPTPTVTGTVTVAGTEQEASNDDEDDTLTMSRTSGTTLPASADTHDPNDKSNPQSEHQEEEQQLKSTREKPERDLDRSANRRRVQDSGGEAFPYRSDPPRERKFRFNLDLDSVKAR